MIRHLPPDPFVPTDLPGVYWRSRFVDFVNWLFRRELLAVLVFVDPTRRYIVFLGSADSQREEPEK